MASQETVACPDCGNTDTHNVSVSNGSSSAYCKSCKKTFRIYMQNGQVKEVKQIVYKETIMKKTFKNL